jgi:hypothetical protein
VWSWLTTFIQRKADSATPGSNKKPKTPRSQKSKIDEVLDERFNNKDDDEETFIKAEADAEDNGLLT